MNFQEASALAKKNPGFKLKKTDDGSFVVINERGGSTASTQVDAIAVPTKGEYLLKSNIGLLENENKELKQRLQKAEEDARQLSRDYYQAESQLKRVSKDEWNIVEVREREIERLAREDEARKREYRDREIERLDREDETRERDYHDGPKRTMTAIGLRYDNPKRTEGAIRRSDQGEIIDTHKRRKCSCGGAVENCHFCFGKGYMEK